MRLSSFFKTKIMKLILSFLFLSLSIFSYSQLNIDSVGRVDYQTLHNTKLNDVWGYTDELGNEYALVGAEDGVGVVDVTDPSSPNEVFWVDGPNSVWRDLKTFGDYAYITTEAEGGLLIIDLSPLPASNALTTTVFFNTTAGFEWESSHNLYIDEDGFAYIFGANRGEGGVIILDIITDPMNPIEVGVYDDWYVHDGYVRNDTMYLGHIYEGTMSIVDVTDNANPVLLGTQFSPTTFCHNVWPTDDGQYAFTTDEVTGGYLGAFDISDPANIIEVDRIKSSPEVGYVIPHNTHVLGNHIVTSYYSDGVVVHDVTYPYNMIEMANYDTYPDQNADYDGCWGVYPFFASGNIVATDRTGGLFVLAPEYKQASYLEGIVTDASNASFLEGVEVSFASNNVLNNSNTIGFYATGTIASGTYSVTYSKVGYYPQTVSVDLLEGVIVNQDVQLIPIPPFSVTVIVLEEGTNTPIIGADIELQSALTVDNGLTNGIGEEAFTLYYQEDYQIFIGSWGHVTFCDTISIDDATGTITVYLRTGYYDDFKFDFGWSTTGTAETGLWERGIPIGTTTGSAPSMDAQNDCGEYAYVTENSENTNPDVGDIDKGIVSLSSPVMDLSSYIDPYVHYSRWFYNEHGTEPLDSLKILVSNGTEIAVIDIVGKDPATFFQWVEKSIRIEDYVPTSSTMQFFFRTSDFEVSDNITEAGLDRFFIVNADELSLEENAKDFIRVFPNPSSSFLKVTGLEDDSEYEVFDIQGNLIKKGLLKVSDSSIDLSKTSDGVYFLYVQNEMIKIIMQK